MTLRVAEVQALARKHEHLKIPAFSADARAQFWALVSKTETCWQWMGSTLPPDGYGIFRGLRAHRVAWTLEHGDIPIGFFVCHHCDNPSCVRPDHLFVGTALDNTRDMYQKGRAVNPTKALCVRGHVLDGPNVGRRKGGRECLVCKRLKHHAMGVKRTKALGTIRSLRRFCELEIPRSEPVKASVLQEILAILDSGGL